MPILYYLHLVGDLIGIIREVDPHIFVRARIAAFYVELEFLSKNSPDSRIRPHLLGFDPQPHPIRLTPNSIRYFHYLPL